MSGRYAEKTTVPVERSEAEIKTLVQRYGARKFMSGTDEDAGLSIIQFEMRDRRVLFKLQLPSENDPAFRYDGRKRRRTDTQVRAAYEQECRRLWRSLVITIKAKLESVESGIESFEEAFLSQLVIPGAGMKTYGEYALPQIAHVYESGELPALLPGIRELGSGRQS